MKRTVLTAAITASLGAFAVPGTAVHAQTENDEESNAVEEVIVTARRREESLQDVPGTVTALSQDVQVITMSGIQSNSLVHVSQLCLIYGKSYVVVTKKSL